MASSGAQGLKRQLSRDSISPPPLKRTHQSKVRSITTKSAIASFFTPTSQKPPDKVKWQERAVNDNSPNTLLIGKCLSSRSAASVDEVTMKCKIAAFDFDSTLISTNSGKKFGGDAQDWKWWHPCVPTTLRKLYEEDGYLVVIISNQAGVTLKANAKIAKAQQSRLASFKSKVSAVIGQLDIPVSIYAATEKDLFRKPRTGMWTELLDDHDLTDPESVDLKASFFVGDAGGRLANRSLAKDFSCSDRNFAENVGVRYMSPEEFFLKQEPRPYTRTFEPSKLIETDEAVITREPVINRRNKQDIVLFCGSPGAGKSTTYWRHLKPLEYERVNQDILKTRDRCLKAADNYLSEGRSVVVDNTNADRDVRAKWVELARKHGVPVRCILFTADEKLCEHNDAVRALNHSMNPENRTLLPGQAFQGFASRYQQPDLSEGFQDIVEVTFQFSGTAAEQAIWARYWT